MRVGLKNPENNYSALAGTSSAGSGLLAGQSAQAMYLGAPLTEASENGLRIIRLSIRAP